MKTAKTKPSKSVSRFTLHESASASALILAVVLTSLLAIIGVMFVMIARVDRMATSAVSENKELDFAVETIVALVSQELALDVPGMPKGKKDYYDYPDANNTWLASLEPYKSGSNYYWRQISDVYNKLVSLELPAEIIPDYQDSSDVNEGKPADADGDGVADSKWVELDDVTSNKGKPIYAAIRIIDNGGMLNVDTAYKFDPNAAGVTAAEIDGSSQMQINLAALSQRGANGSLATAADKLQAWRCGTESNDLSLYEQNVVWRYDNPSGAYTPFDIGDELKLRNRYILNYNLMTSRIEKLWTKAFDWGLDVPRNKNDHSINDPNDWFWYANNSSPDIDDYDYRHIATTYNMDRIIDPYGKKMVNINRDDANSIYMAIKSALDPNFVGANEAAAQIAVNLVDFRDSDSNVSTIDVNSVRYYGFERSCIYISELVHRFVEPNIPPGLPRPASLINRSYAIELHKPYTEDIYPEPNQWQLNIEGYGTFPVNWSSGTQHFHVMLFEQPNAPLSVKFDLTDKDPNFPPLAEKTQTLRAGIIVFAPGKTISLERRVGTDWISVDSVTVKYGPGPPYRVWDIDGQVHSYQRDITLHKCIRRLWDDSFSEEASATLGDRNVYENGDLIYIQAHPYLDPLIYPERGFTNVGEIGMLFRKPTYYEAGQPIPSGVIGYSIDSDTEEEVRIDLADPNFQQLFKYLTVFDPYNFHPADANYANETRIKGRININTAPWFVLAQLPWVSQRVGYNNPALAQAIVAYRDKLNLSSTGGPDYYHSGASNSRRQETGLNNLREAPGFESIGELATVINNSPGKEEYSMSYYTLGSEKNVDLAGFPDLTPGTTGDGAADDFEERDVIFARISNLVTVRSDVFTAYILVRIGTDGPQKRVMAILDRSDVYSGDGKVRIVALHPVPDPR